MLAKRPHRRRRAAYILTVWTEPGSSEQPVWRGMLETVDGARRYFDSLDGLGRLLTEHGGWQEPPAEDRLVE